MAVTRKYTDALPVQLTQAWRDRVKVVADHERIQDSMASVIRDCIETALPRWEIELGILDIAELDDEQLAAIGLARAVETPRREDRAAGSFGWTPAE